MERSSFLENDNPVDFLYLDRKRIASLIGQLSEKGQLTGLKSVASKTTQREAGADASIPGFAKFDGKRSATIGESMEETWDPFWTNAYTFLKDLEENFAGPLERARLGSLVKFEAFIQFVDLRMMRNLWEPTIQAFVNSSQPHKPATSRKGRQAQQQVRQQLSQEQRLFLQIMKEVPHLFHMMFLARAGENNVYRLWASISPEHLTINSEDLAMKYGSVVDGLWQVVGIVDANPGASATPWPVNAMIDGVVASLSAIREQVGRPNNYFGLTPIAIYSPLKGFSQTEVEATS